MVQLRIQFLRNKKVLLGFCLVFVIFIIFESCRRRPFYPNKPADFPLTDKFITSYNSYTGRSNEVKRILLWTPWFRGWWWLSEAGGALPTCSYRCDVTRDRAKLNDSSAILFHADDLWENRQSLSATLYNPVVPLPASRNSNQVWVLWSVEPVCHFFGDAPAYVFNWTAHYRRDSTIRIPYATYLKKTTSENSQSSLVTNYFASKTKMAVTVASNCRVPSRRYRIIRELSKFIDIDQFGSCTGHVVCPKNKGEFECDKYVVSYKFYLAFENSYCRDYLSEKFWRALERNQIPVIAVSDASVELLPNNSYLNVFDFPTIQDLANRMIEIGNDENLYNSFFLWKNDYVKDEEHAFCKLCRALHENRTRQSYHDLEGWITYDSCSKPSAWRLIAQFLDRLLFDLGIW